MKKHSKIAILIIGLILLIGSIYFVTAATSISPSLNLNGQNRFSIINYTQLFINQNTDDKAIQITSNASSEENNALGIFNSGTGRGIYVESTGNKSRSLNIKNTGWNVTAVSIDTFNTAFSSFKLENNASSTSNNALYFGGIYSPTTMQRGVQIMSSSNGSNFYTENDNPTNTYLFEGITYGSRILGLTNKNNNLGDTSFILGRFNNSNFDNRLYRNLPSSATAAPVLLLDNANESDDQATLKLINTGSGMPLIISKNSTSSICDSNSRGGIYNDGTSLNYCSDSGEIKINSWSNISNFPVACPAGSYLTQLGSSVTCSTISEISNNLNISGNLTSDLIPHTNNLYSLGSSLLRWTKGWFVNLDVSGIVNISSETADYGFIGCTGSSCDLEFKNSGGKAVLRTTGSSLVIRPNDAGTAATFDTGGVTITNLNVTTGFTGSCVNITYSGGIAITCND